MFARKSIGLQSEQLNNGNPAASTLGIRPAEMSDADLYACLFNGGETRIGGGRNTHEPKAPGWDRKNGTFKTAGSQNCRCQSHRKRVML